MLLTVLLESIDRFLLILVQAIVFYKLEVQMVSYVDL